MEIIKNRHRSEENQVNIFPTTTHLVKEIYPIMKFLITDKKWGLLSIGTSIRNITIFTLSPPPQSQSISLVRQIISAENVQEHIPERPEAYYQLVYQMVDIDTTLSELSRALRDNLKIQKIHDEEISRNYFFRVWGRTLSEEELYKLKVQIESLRVDLRNIENGKYSTTNLEELGGINVRAVIEPPIAQVLSQHDNNQPAAVVQTSSYIYFNYIFNSILNSCVEFLSAYDNVNDDNDVIGGLKNTKHKKYNTLNMNISKRKFAKKQKKTKKTKKQKCKIQKQKV
jgi:hypothetical protein